MKNCEDTGNEHEPVNKAIMELTITLHSSMKFRNVVLRGVPIKVPKHLLEGFHSVLENWQVNNSPKKSTCCAAQRNTLNPLTKLKSVVL